ncbi:hypothetical protein HanIR_Chr14g0699331 [Helianthus annuus]|nr:hypothetical protein HanIR_Chr14g0699331 [Helianthus annuus]
MTIGLGWPLISKKYAIIPQDYYSSLPPPSKNRPTYPSPLTITEIHHLLPSQLHLFH